MAVRRGRLPAGCRAQRQDAGVASALRGCAAAVARSGDGR